MLPLTWPNRITILRILMIGPFVVALLNVQEPGYEDLARWAALGIFVLMALSDGLDGYLARKWHEESAVGRFLDPLADKILIFVSMIILALEHSHVPGARLPSWVVVAAIGKDLIVILGFCVVYFTTTRIYIAPRPVGKWCTTSQLVLIIATLLAPDLPAMFRLVLTVLEWAATLLAMSTVVVYFQLARKYVARYEVKDGDAPAQ